MYFKNLSGIIPTNKQVEFEQTYRLVITQLPEGCRPLYMAKDVIHDCVYHIRFHAESLQVLQSFTHSSNFIMLVGAFSTLGKLYENQEGEFHLS